MRDVYIVGEDDATRAVIERIIADYNPNLNILQSLPARGSQIKAMMSRFNTLATRNPVILLTDLDDDPCAPIGKQKLLAGMVQSHDFILNIAYDEVEAWLMADTDGFSTYFSIPKKEMPAFTLQKMQGRKALSEISLDVKSSWHLTHRLSHRSTNSTVKDQISVPIDEPACKGKEYNSAIVPFVRNAWNPEAARQVSDSLNRMILRIQNLC